MADLSITAANVVPGSTAQISRGYAGETITAGQAVYQSTSDNLFYKADANNTSATAQVAGVALHASLAGQPVDYITSGTVTIGATVVAGKWYVLSTTAGGIAPMSDLATSSYSCVIGYATTTAILQMNIVNTGVVHG